MIILSRVSNFADLGETDDSRNSGTKSVTNYLVLMLFLAGILIGFSIRFLKYKDLPRVYTCIYGREPRLRP